MLLRWPTQIFNAIVSLKGILNQHQARNHRAIVQRCCQSPLTLEVIYRGVTVTSAIAKAFEYIFLSRMGPLLREHGMLHCSQKAYQRHIMHMSCADAAFVTSKPGLHEDWRGPGMRGPRAVCGLEGSRHNNVIYTDVLMGYITMT